MKKLTKLKLRQFVQISQPFHTDLDSPNPKKKYIYPAASVKFASPLARESTSQIPPESCLQRLGAFSCRNFSIDNYK